MISIIVAAAQNNVIGKDNQLIWHLPLDMKYFMEKTTGHCIITGRKNYESIPLKFRPLKNRTNIVVTRQSDYSAPGAIVTASLQKAIETAQSISDSEIFIIGGADIYRQSLSLCQRIYLTRIHQPFEGDVFFPELNMEEWTETSRTKGIKDEKNNYDYDFITYQRK